MSYAYSIIFVLCLLSTDLNATEKTDYSAEVKKAQLALTNLDYDTAYNEYLTVAENSQNPLAQFSIALFHKLGWGRSVDKSKACNWFTKAANGNIPAAQHYYADCVRHGISQKANPALAAKWYEQASQNGHIISLCSLAELYIDGLGVARDTQRGLALCQQAANTGLAQAMLRLAKFHLSNNPKLYNERKAKSYLEQAAQRKNSQAQYLLGKLYRHGGKHIQRNYYKARQWMEMSAALGFIPAYYQTGLLYVNAPLDATTKALPATDLAKAYLWLSATVERSQDNEELANANELLTKIATIMPATWHKNLNEKLKDHLQRFPKTEGMTIATIN